MFINVAYLFEPVLQFRSRIVARDPAGLLFGGRRARARRLPLLRAGRHILDQVGRVIIGLLLDNAHVAHERLAPVFLGFETVLLHVYDGSFHVADADLGLGRQVDVDEGVKGGLGLAGLGAGKVAQDADEDGEEEEEADTRDDQVDESVQVSLPLQLVQEALVLGHGLDLDRVARHIGVLVQTVANVVVQRVVDWLDRADVVCISGRQGRGEANHLGLVRKVTEHLALVLDGFDFPGELFRFPQGSWDLVHELIVGLGTRVKGGEHPRVGGTVGLVL